MNEPSEAPPDPASGARALILISLICATITGTIIAIPFIGAAIGEPIPRWLQIAALCWGVPALAISIPFGIGSLPWHELRCQSFLLRIPACLFYFCIVFTLPVIATAPVLFVIVMAMGSVSSPSGYTVRGLDDRAPAGMVALFALFLAPIVTIFVIVWGLKRFRHLLAIAIVKGLRPGDPYISVLEDWMGD